jgi:putative endonuclease
MPFFLYVLGSWRKGDQRTYVGWTTDVDRRLRQHNAGTGAKSTRGRQWMLLYSERCKTKREAMSREWHVKRDRKFRATLRATISARRKQRQSLDVPAVAMRRHLTGSS